MRKVKNGMNICTGLGSHLLGQQIDDIELFKSRKCRDHNRRCYNGADHRNRNISRPLQPGGAV